MTTQQHAAPMCTGVRPLTARREPWMDDLLADADRCAALLEEYGSPVNVINPSPLQRNADELTAAAREAGVAFRVFVARKANKALSIVDEANRLGLGIDVGSERELRQVLDRGVHPDDVIVTAAVKPDSLLRLCLERDVPLALDNLDEGDRLLELAAESSLHGDTAPRVALRISIEGSNGEGNVIAPTRFGEAAALWLGWMPELRFLRIEGVHFHLHGYAAADRVAGIRQAVALVDQLRTRGWAPHFVDMGGGIPMSYLDDGSQWDAFWRDPVTWRGRELQQVYPYHQAPVRGGWLARVLAEAADDIASRGLELRCEPGRSVLDGCGMTLARVAFRKETSDGLPIVGLEMNRTQCRTTSDDYLVDPVLVRPSSARPASPPMTGAYLVGAYCIEAELLFARPFDFPSGVAVGDVVAIPNTAGYFMHILESASHQIPLARNVVLDATKGADEIRLDPIDAL
ncbi:Y4yA family PLP-dependent enzyme [Luteococcus sanguinis]|uniref:Y4yA family PLP-dependent enzyme n=1 Tax=Luteococcus sanguinis TaxID=174038 RepID=A0ABW1X435_9ACTN